MDFHAVYDQAIEATKEAKDRRDALEQSPEDFIEAVVKAREHLKWTILEGATEKILDSAADGASACSVYAFNGNDVIDDISVLFLLKGQRRHAAPPPVGTPGPLFPELQEMMTPFILAHDWDGISGGNRIMARWA